MTNRGADTLLYWGCLIFVLMLGLCIGSFCNVLIHRLPRGESIVRPASRCPYCGNPISPGDNIPILSYIALRGECRSCFSPISVRYPLAEALTAVLFALCYIRFGWTLALIPSCVLSALLVVSAFVDMEHRMVLDELIIAGFVVAVPMNVFLGVLCTWLEMLIGIAVCALPLALIAIAGRSFTGRHVLGGGDIKIMAMAGAFIGWPAAVLPLAVGSVVGGVVIAVLLLAKKINRKQEVPFVPFLAVGIFAAMLVGEPMIDWYFSLFV